MKSRSRQQGFTLIELIMVIGIMVVIAIIQFQEQTLRTEQQRARALGGELLQYNNAVRNYISYYSGVSGSAAFAGTKTGVNWLKSTSCGGQIPDVVNKAGFIGCDYLSDTGGLTSYGRMSFTTTLTTPVANQTMTGVTVMSELKLRNRSRGDLAGLAALVAAGASTTEGDPLQIVTDARVYYCITESKTECSGNLSRIVMRASSDSNNDTWLRTDGGNTMNNPITFNSDTDTANRQIRNVARIFNNDLQALTLGDRGGAASTASDVIVDADAEVIGALNVRDGITAPFMRDLNDPTFIVDPNGASRMNRLDLTGDMTTAGNITAAGNITSDKDVTGKRFVDRDNSAYFVDPDGTSRINRLELASITGRGASNERSLAINSDVVNFNNTNGAKDLNAPVTLSGYANVSDLKVRTRNGNYVALSDILPDYVNMGSYRVTNGSQVPKPSCASGSNGAGAPKVIVSPMNEESHDAYSFSFMTGAVDHQYSISDYTSGRSYMGALDSGSVWTISAGTGTSADSGTAVGLATVYCSY